MKTSYQEEAGKQEASSKQMQKVSQGGGREQLHRMLLKGQV